MRRRTSQRGCGSRSRTDHRRRARPASDGLSHGDRHGGPRTIPRSDNWGRGPALPPAHGFLGVRDRAGASPTGADRRVAAGRRRRCAPTDRVAGGGDGAGRRAGGARLSVWTVEGRAGVSSPRVLRERQEFSTSTGWKSTNGSFVDGGTREEVDRGVHARPCRYGARPDRCIRPGRSGESRQMDVASEAVHWGIHGDRRAARVGTRRPAGW